jgi:hypothetical protein
LPPFEKILCRSPGTWTRLTHPILELSFSG